MGPSVLPSSTRTSFRSFPLVAPAGGRVVESRSREVEQMLEETQEREEIIERIAALDVGKAELVCCVRVPGPPGKTRRVQEVTTHKTMTRTLLAMVDRLRELGVTRVVMEATSDYWKPPFYLLEAAGFETWLVNAKDVKHLPGRPKTD
jgi:transposase